MSALVVAERCLDELAAQHGATERGTRAARRTGCSA